MGSIFNFLQHRHQQQPSNLYNINTSTNIEQETSKTHSSSLDFVDDECGNRGMLDAFSAVDLPGKEEKKCCGAEREKASNVTLSQPIRKALSTKTTNITTFSYFFDWRSEENLPMDFCKNSSLHGLKYIGERKQHIVERMFWTVAFTTGLVVACIMISDVWKKYKSNSVIITFAPYETKIEELPFPAVTICNMNKILKSKALKIMNEAKGFSGSVKRSEALENLYYLNHVCSTSRSFTKMFNYSVERGTIDNKILNNANKNKENYDGGKEDLFKFFVVASPLCTDMILKCIWQKEVRNCSELFTPLETDNGKCCTFNMVPPSILHRFNMTGMKEDPSVAKNWEWDGESLIKSRKNEEGIEGYSDFPRRQKIPGQSFGLSILLNPGLEEYFCTSSDSHGFRMTAHLPIDIPHLQDFGLAIKPNSEVFVNIRPEVTIADKDTIGSFPAEQRECYFNGERDLGYYTFYTAKNCIDECLANLTYQECNCRRHYQPGEDSKPLCGPKQFHCASNIKRKFVGTYKTRCRSCIPTCNEIQYHTETTYTPLQGSDVLWRDQDGNMAPWSEKNVSIVHIFFGEDSTNAKLRKELYGMIDLIANFGGLMGLCLGFSGLSLIELLYFLTLRAWCRIKRSNVDGRKSGLRVKNTNKLSGGRIGRRKSLKRTETTTELIDLDEEQQQNEVDGEGEREEEDDGGFLEMRTMVRGMVNKPHSPNHHGGDVNIMGRGRRANGISIISNGPVLETRKCIEAILQSVIVKKAAARTANGVNNRGNSTTPTTNGVMCNYSLKSSRNGNGEVVGCSGRERINLAPIVESDNGGDKQVYRPLAL